MSAEKTIEILKTIYSLTVRTPYSKTLQTRRIIKKPEQEFVLKIFEV